MLKRCLLLALFFALGVGLAAALPTRAEEKVDAQRIAKLIEQLGSGKFTEREEATKALEKVGVPALEALRKATKSDDAETRRRAEELVDKLSKVEESSKILVPTKI